MSNWKNLMAVSAALLLTIAVAPAWASELAGNGGFEVAGGSATDSALWSEFLGGAAGTVSERSATLPAAGAWAHHLLAVGAASPLPIGGVAGITQNSFNDLGLVSLEPGTTLSASLSAATNYGVGGVGFVGLRILNAAGTIVANTGLQVIGHNNLVYTTVNTANLIVPAFGAAPNDYYTAYLEISVNAGAIDGSTAEAYIDNVSIQGTLVPEPATLLALALAALVARRR